MKNCLECGEKIVGREDKKFCSDGCPVTDKTNEDSFISCVHYNFFELSKEIKPHEQNS
jgi:hypothetical protein